MRGMVASAHPLATVAGVRMLMAGGNAFDAAVATAAALGVAEPYMSGLAGLGVACCYVADERRVRALDFVPTVPRRLETDARRGATESNAAQTAGTPGNLAGWWELLSRYGSKPPAKCCNPPSSLRATVTRSRPSPFEFYEICIERHAAQSEWPGHVYPRSPRLPPPARCCGNPTWRQRWEQFVADRTERAV